MAIPFQRLGIPKQFRRSVGPDAPKTAKIAVAKGLIPTTADVQLALLYVLAVDKDKVVAKAARGTMKAMPVPQVLSGISQTTFPKVLEFIAQFRPDRELDQRLLQLRSTPDRAAEMVARRADGGLCEVLVRNQERLLMTPSVFISLHANPKCSDEELANAESFLRLHNALQRCRPSGHLWSPMRSSRWRSSRWWSSPKPTPWTTSSMIHPRPQRSGVSQSLSDPASFPHQWSPDHQSQP